ncbi:MAG: hypothetical protein M1817_005433 [Caeruleum heppii]|nr:MAG: hypothetical protein M1817_005433 [Caeruleum heppii]
MAAPSVAATTLRPLRRKGQKEIFLPNFTITLLRTPFLPPVFASFLVPLNLNKLDLRDYLHHAYGLRTRSIRSYVQQQRVQQDKTGARRPSPRRWFRPRSIKRMTVEMDRPFVWPEAPDDFSAWDKSTFDAIQDAQETERNSYKPDANQKPAADRDSIAEQARRLLRGEEKWRDRKDGRGVEKLVWEDVGEAVEVETDVDMRVDETGDGERRA